MSTIFPKSGIIKEVPSAAIAVAIAPTVHPIVREKHYIFKNYHGWNWEGT